MTMCQVMRRIEALRSLASEEAMDNSRSFASRRQRPCHLKVRAPTQRRAMTTPAKPCASPSGGEPPLYAQPRSNAAPQLLPDMVLNPGKLVLVAVGKGEVPARGLKLGRVLTIQFGEHTSEQRIDLLVSSGHLH